MWTVNWKWGIHLKPATEVMFAVGWSSVAGNRKAYLGAAVMAWNLDLDFPRDTEQALEQNVVLHAPYLPCWLPPNQPLWFSSTCFGDSETKFLLAFPLSAVMPLGQHVLKNSSICEWKMLGLENSEQKILLMQNLQNFSKIQTDHIKSKRNPKKTDETYFFISKVDSSWKTCAREKTVLVFLLRLQCIIWLLPSVDRSMDSSSSSSSIDSLTSSSDSCDEFKCWCGDEVVVAVFGELVTDAECLSGDLSSKN